MDLFTLLNANNYFCVNRELARAIGINAAIMLSEIIDKFCYFERLGQLQDGWFYLTVPYVEERTTLAKDAQLGAIKVLRDLGFIDTKMIGMPAKRGFLVFKEKITEWLGSCWRKPASLVEESRQHGVGIVDTKVEEFPTPAPIYKRQEEETRYEVIAQSNGVGVPEAPPPPAATPTVAKIFFSFETRKFENVTAQDLEEWLDVYPCADVPRELLKAAQWCLSNLRKAKSKTRWRKFITEWLDKAHNDGIRNKARTSASQNWQKDRSPREPDGNLKITGKEDLF